MLFDKRKREIDVLENYIRANDSIYSFDIISNEYKEFEDKYYELNIKQSAGIKEFEKYTDEYVLSQKVDMLRNLFILLPNMHDWSKMLKVIVNNRKHIKYFLDAGMLLGEDNKELSPREIVINEDRCKKRLEQLKVQYELNELFGKKR